MARRKKHSPTLLPDNLTGRSVPVVLNSKYISIDSLIGKSERTRTLAKFGRDNASSFCLFSGETFRVSQNAGICLASQIEDICEHNDLSDIEVVSQHGSFLYIATVEASFVTNEVILDVESEEAQQALFRDIAALKSVVGAQENVGLEVIDAELYLSGRAAKHHTFLPDTKAFGEAGYLHPKRKRAIAGFATIAMMAIVGLVLFFQYQAREEQKRLQEQAKKIVPKIGSDDIVPQLRAYARWLQENLDTYKYYGAQSLTIKGNNVEIQGRVRKDNYLEFYERHKEIKKLPTVNFANETFLDLQQTVQAESSDPFGASNWRLRLLIEENIQKTDKFGLELYENYLAAIYAASLRHGLGFSAAPPPTSISGMVQSNIIIQGEISSMAILYNIANMMIGIPSYATELIIVTPSDDSRPATFTMKVVMSGRS